MGLKTVFVQEHIYKEVHVAFGQNYCARRSGSFTPTASAYIDYNILY